MNKLLLVALIALSSCGVSEIYNEAKGANDATFAAAMIRMCGPAAFLPASRQLTPDEQADRLALCAKYDARMLAEYNEQ